jgi:hypothetical protein
MKKRFILLIGTVLLAAIAFSSFSLAQGTDDAAGPGGMKGAMMGQGKTMTKGPMQGMMMKKMMDISMVATQDGGVIVLAGNKLMKYDQDLNLVKEAEIKVDMMKDCPMMINKGMGPGPDAAAAAPVVETEAELVTEE